MHREARHAKQASRRRQDGKQASAQNDLARQADDVVGKIRRLGTWDKQANEFEQALDQVYRMSGMNSESEQFFRRVLVETQKHPPWAVNERLQTGLEIIASRYQLNEEQTRQLKALIIRMAIGGFTKYGAKLMPLVREALDTRINRKPITPEQVARWTKVVRPIAEEYYADWDRSLQPLLKTLSPGQRQMVDKDLGILDRRLKELMGTMKNHWEKGKWKPEHWAMQNDPIQMGQVAAVSAPPAQTEMLAAHVSAQRGPMRLGESGPGRAAAQTASAIPLPDEDAWVSYVQAFCARYGLDKAQRASAYAILKDLQEQAQSYRSTQGEAIASLQAQLRQAQSPEDRSAIQAELREVLRGVDELFGQLKTRLESIPTSDQMRRAG